MKENKFRGYWMDHMLEVIQINYSGRKTVILSDGIMTHINIPLADIELMQATGKKDKNDKDIYDGDIVKCYVDTDDDGNDLYLLYKVVWHDIYHCWMFSIIQTTDMKDEFIEDEFFYQYNSIHIEVIGNIFENPELLGK